MKDWLYGVFITAIFLILIATLIGVFIGLAWLDKHEPIVGVPVEVILILILGGFVISGARKVS